MEKIKYLMDSILEKIDIRKTVILLSSIVLTIIVIMLIVFFNTKNKFELNKEKIIIDINTSETIYTTLKSEENNKVVWTSLNELIAIVDKDGRVTGVTTGTTLVEAKYNEEILKCEIVVVQLSSELKMAQNVVLDLESNREYKLETVMNKTIVTEDTEFRSLNKNVVTVSNDGRLTATGDGTTTVIATFNEMSALCEVVVKGNQNVNTNNNKSTNTIDSSDKEKTTTIMSNNIPSTSSGVTRLSILETMIYLQVGKSRLLTLTIYPKTLTNETVMWTSSNKEIAIVNGEGKVTAIKEGTAIITATASNGKKTTCVVSVLKEGIKKPLISPIVEIASAEVGNTGGEKYWDWYLGWKTAWCAIFVSWVANEADYIEKEIVPKFLSCRKGVEWFKDKGKWKDRSYIASPGDIIFFDYNHDGITNHVGIVEKVEGNTVYTIEGNYDDQVKRSQYDRNDLYVLGYGITNY